jgi:hypothetical protein
MTAVGFIGSGYLGGTVARLAVAAGYDVVLSNSRGPRTLTDLVRELGPHARASTPAEAAAAGELVVVSIPPRAYPAVPVQPLAGKPVLDTINYIPQRDGPIPGLGDGSLSSSEVLQRPASSDPRRHDPRPWPVHVEAPARHRCRCVRSGAGGGDPFPASLDGGAPRFVPACCRWVGLPWVGTGAQGEYGETMTTLENRPNSALLVIDVQNGVVGGAHERDAVVANVGGLVEKARRERVPVVWVQHSDEQLARGSDDWRIIPELAPADAEPLVEKNYGDSFEDTTLETVLSSLGVGRLVVVGAQTDACIRSTLHGALVRGYDATLVSDAHTTEDQTAWGAPPPDQVIAHTNLYWTYQTAPGRTAGTVQTKDVDFGGTS